MHLSLNKLTLCMLLSAPCQTRTVKNWYKPYQGLCHKPNQDSVAYTLSHMGLIIINKKIYLIGFSKKGKQ